MKTGCSTSVEMCNDPNTTIKQRREKKMHWIDEVEEDNRNGEVYGQKSMGTFGKEDVYFFGEVGNWVTKRFGKPKWRIVPQDELWRWSKKRLESIVSRKLAVKEEDLLNKGNRELGREDEGEASGEASGQREANRPDVGLAEAVLEYLKRRVSSNTSQSTVYNLCQGFYEENQGQTHLNHSCTIDKRVLCASKQVYLKLARQEKQKESREEEGRMTGAEDWADRLKVLETDEIEVLGKANEQKWREVREGVDKLDEVFGQAGGYLTLRRLFQSRWEIHNNSPTAIVNKRYEQSKFFFFSCIMCFVFSTMGNKDHMQR